MLHGCGMCVCVWVRGRGYASEWLLVAAILAISMRIAVTSNHIKLKAFPTCSHRPNYGVQAQVWKVTHGHYLYLFKWCITTASCCLFAWIQADWPSWLISRLHSGAGVLRGFFGWEAEKVGSLSKVLRCSWHCRPPCKSRVCEWQKWGDTFWMIDPQGKNGGHPLMNVLSHGHWSCFIQVRLGSSVSFCSDHRCRRASPQTFLGQCHQKQQRPFLPRILRRRHRRRKLPHPSKITCFQPQK